MPLKETYDTASMALSEMVHKTGVKAVLTGEGADEFFSGYVGYKFDVTRQGRQSDFLTDEERAINEIVYGDPDFFYERSLSSLEKTKSNLYSDELVASLREFSAIGSPIIKPCKLKGLDSQQKRSYIDYKMRLPEHLLADHGDRMVFANSVEARYPFLDINMIELATQIPSKYKLNNMIEKYILKKMAKGLVPDEIIQRTKFAFVAPGASELVKLKNEYIEYLLSERYIKKLGVFNPNEIKQLKLRYAAPNFKLNLPFDTDYLIFVLTICAFCDIYNVSI